MHEVTLTKAVRYQDKRYEAGEKLKVDEETLEQLQRHEACTDVKEVQEKVESKAQRKPRKTAADADKESGE